ncbi:bile acid-CoA:amino acid N-acyltransferase-like [Oncorhynchus nerka]|uniref:bile acid-CoA:amino acid N-acyltransferase-like n=1 Tax=Oncorhynchus nerka TaxID=8023 RepID=UPI0031B86A2E
MAPVVQKIDIYKDGIQGTLFIPAGPGPFPAELDLSGGGGGLFEHRSSLLASESYVSLVLQYPTDVSTTVAIGCKYFEMHSTVCGRGQGTCVLPWGWSPDQTFLHSSLPLQQLPRTGAK